MNYIPHWTSWGLFSRPHERRGRIPDADMGRWQTPPRETDSRMLLLYHLAERNGNSDLVRRDSREPLSAALAWQHQWTTKRLTLSLCRAATFSSLSVTWALRTGTPAFLWSLASMWVELQCLSAVIRLREIKWSALPWPTEFAPHNMVIIINLRACGPLAECATSVLESRCWWWKHDI